MCLVWHTDDLLDCYSTPVHPSIYRLRTYTGLNGGAGNAGVGNAGVEKKQER